MKLASAHRQDAVKVSVIVPAYNAADYLRQSVESILGQSFADFELIVVDDCSTDSTYDILASYGDPRLRIVRNPQNMGVVGARNRAFEEARGEYVAAFDADDISLPTRLAKQVAYLDAHPNVALMGTASRYLEDGELRPGRRVAGSTPLLVRWLLHVSNPLVHASLMYRADTIRRLGVLLREECKYAEDFDLHHRIMQVADVAFLDDPLILYRRHPGAITAKHESAMLAKAIEVLAGSYGRWFGPDAHAAATLVLTHVMAGKPARDERTIQHLGEVLSRMTDGFCETYGVGPADRAVLLRQASEAWWRAVRSAMRSGRIGALALTPPPFARDGRAGFLRTQALPAVASGLVPFKRALRPVLQGAGSAVCPAAAPESATSLFSVRYEPVPDEADRPPTLFVVVDAEAGFDPGESMAALERGQAVFDRYGLRPIYAADYPVASEPAGYETLRAIHDRGGCEIGALLNPAVSPPFEEGDPPDLEERKLVALLDAIRGSLRVTPRFFKAGCGGLGPDTMRIVAEHGIAVDLSIVPGRDLSPQGGPDFRGFGTARRSLLDGRLISVPMTRGPSGLLASRLGGLAGRIGSPALARLGLLETVALTPEGEPAAKQVALIRAMLARRQRSFVLHYRAASLAPGPTPHARTEQDADRIVHRLDAVCRFFFEEIGGMPGHPQDLLPPALRTAPRLGTTPARHLAAIGSLMSRAFVSEDAAAASAAAVPERPVSRLPNLVTPRGLRLIEQRIADLQTALALREADAPDRPGLARDLRYWRARRASAQLVEPGAPLAEAAFGTAVTIRRDDVLTRYRIVGEDEADPAAGLLSWASPLAAALMGARAGDIVELGGDRPAVTVEAVEPG